MELEYIKIVLEKYFQGETNIDEENELKNYFSDSKVAPELRQYKPIFSYFSESRLQSFDSEIKLKPKKGKMTWLFIAASLLVLLGIGSVSYFNFNSITNRNQYLGTFDNPEVAFIETQKILSMLSININTGFKSVQYIQEYDNSKNLIFKKY